jgi:hypothetical protein
VTTEGGACLLGDVIAGRVKVPVGELFVWAARVARVLGVETTPTGFASRMTSSTRSIRRRSRHSWPPT